MPSAAGLTFLYLEDNAGIGDTVLPIVGQQLRLLKQLYLHHTGVTDLGVQWLRHLKVVHTLGLCCCRVTQMQLADWKAIDRECCGCRMARN